MAIPPAAPTPSAANQALIKLGDLLHEKAEIFAAPSTSKASAKAIYEGTLRTTKQLFDESLRDEPTSLGALARLLSEIRGSENLYNDRIETRSKAAARSSSKGKGKAAFRDNPIFQPTPLQELYLGDDGQDGALSANDAEIAQRMVWEQLEMRTNKVLDVFREIVRDGDPSDDEDAGEEIDGMEEEDDDEADFDSELLEGASDEDSGEDDEEMTLDGEEDGLSEDALEDGDLEDDDDADPEDLEEDEDDGDDAELDRSEPYFTQLRDDSALEDDEAAVVPSTKSGKKSKAAAQPATAKGNSPLDAGFFSLSDFHSQTYAGEDEMRRYMRQGKSKSVNDLQSSLDEMEGEDDDENDDIDYFAPVAGSGLDGSDEEEEEEEEEDEDGMNVENMRYEDFWNPPKQLYGSAPGAGSSSKPQKGKDGAKGQAGKPTGKDKSAAATTKTNGKPEAVTGPDQGKRRVSFHDAVKVQEFQTDNPGKQSAVAALVKKVGMKEAMKRLAKGDIDEEDLADDDGEAGEDDLMLSDMLDEDGEPLSEDDEEAEESDEEDEEDAEDGESVMSDESGDQDVRAMRRIQSDLFADEDADDSSALTAAQKKASQSRYESRMSALSEQIAELEAENVAEKDWTLRGEAKSRDRPVNSLLEEDLEFDQVAKVVPVVTEESSLTLEEKIKKRILDDQFDDVVRRRKHEAAAYLPSRLLDIKDTQSDRSLAEIYADEFATERARANGETAAVPEVDTNMQKEHDLISSIFDEVCGKLDALSNARFTPKPAQTQITTVSNLPSVSLESALPTSASTSTLLAPEEVYAPAQRGTLTSKAEMTPSQKKAARVKARKARQTTLKSIQKYGGSTGSVKQAKDRAMNSLIGKRGVTVIGKGKAARSALTGKDRRQDGEAGRENAATSANAYKL